MTKTTTQLKKAVEIYFNDLQRIRALGGGTGERSFYGPLANLLNAVGDTLKPKVSCVIELADQGAGHPDLGLYAARQMQKGQPREGQIPECGVIEVKPAGDDTWMVAKGDQVSRYWERYRLVLVTNTHDFILVGEDLDGRPAKLETFRLAENAEEFERLLETPHDFADKVGARFGEYLCRALSHRARLAEPKDLAWLLASYARDALSRVEASNDTSALTVVRLELENALGVRFEGDRGTRFFHSTLVQTLFYGVFSAWVLWTRQTPPPDKPFNWHEAVWHLRVPVLRVLFQQLSDPGRLRPLGLVEVLDWTADALDRVDQAAFFAHFNEGEAVPYFYEPFLEAFDPALRKQLGVWYTPTEVVRYMVARVDKALKDDLGIADGLAAENVYVLDPCCGTGAYLAEVLHRIANNMKSRGLGALTGARVKQAALERVFGFEIMPAPLVVAHLQVGLTMQTLDAPLADDETERPSIFLTNALTGWEPEWDPEKIRPQLFPELKEERDRAEEVKRKTPILVILGNPPYNRYPGVGMSEERALTLAYRAPKRVELLEKKALNDLYIRFFRMAERRIAENTGQGIVCFISNYSWLDGLAFAGMRERYLEAFDAVRIDCLNGDKYKTGKVAPDGSPDPSIFSTPSNPAGIQVGTAITTLVRRVDHTPSRAIGFRHLWGQTKRKKLLDTAESEPDDLYTKIVPVLPLGLPFGSMAVSEEWFDWPALPDLFPVFFSGANTNRDPFLVDIDLGQLKHRLIDYFNPVLSHDEIARRYPAIMKPLSYFDAIATRETLLRRGGPTPTGFIPYTYRPFDTRWLYWEADTKLLNDKRADYLSQVFEDNLWLSAAKHLRKHPKEPQACFARHLSSLHLIERGANMFPAYLRYAEKGNDSNSAQLRPNVTIEAGNYLRYLDASVEDLFYHVLAVLHTPAYREANADGLRMGWPRIPLPGWPDGKAEGTADALVQSAARGRELARLLDPEAPVPGVTQGALRQEIAAIAVPATGDGRNMTGDDFAVTAGWGHFGSGQAVMPGKGRAIERDYTRDERIALGDAILTLGETTFDIYLNDRAYWRNIPAAIWDYKLGGYQVLKKWLSYREHKVLDRALSPEEVQYFADTARRIGAILLMATHDVL